MKISLVMIVKNEEENLKYCLDKIYNKVDEIVIVDTGSNDKTKTIAARYTNKIYDFVWSDDFSKARNFAIEKCTGDWILSLDADEYIKECSKDELIEFALNNENKIGRICIISRFINDGEESISKEYVSRFFKKGIYFKGIIHEQLDSDYERVNMNIKVEHNGYYKNNKFERNIKLLEKEYKNNPYDEYIIYQIARTYFVDKKYKQANVYFEKCYKMIDNNKFYYKNLVISYIYSCIEEKNFEKGMDLIKENYDFYKNSSEFYFVQGVFYMNLILSDIKTYFDFLYLIEDSYLKCLELGEIEDDNVLGLGSYKAAYNLGLYYESFNDFDKANYYYKLSSSYGYEKAYERISIISK